MLRTAAECDGLPRPVDDQVRARCGARSAWVFGCAVRGRHRFAPCRTAARRSPSERGLQREPGVGRTQAGVRRRSPAGAGARRPSRARATAYSQHGPDDACPRAVEPAGPDRSRDPGTTRTRSAGRRKRLAHAVASASYASLLIIVVVVLASPGAADVRRLVQPYYIPSASMEPTLHGCPGCNDDHVLVDKVSYRATTRAAPATSSSSIARRAGTVRRDVLIKRVIALPGDTVALRDGHVYVNGLLLDEPYVNKKCNATADTAADQRDRRGRFPSGDVFVHGRQPVRLRGQPRVRADPRVVDHRPGVRRSSGRSTGSGSL